MDVREEGVKSLSGSLKIIGDTQGWWRTGALDEGRGRGSPGVSLFSRQRKQTNPGPMCFFLPLQICQVQPLCVIDANDPPNGPARRILNLQMTAFAGTTNHQAL